MKNKVNGYLFIEILIVFLIISLLIVGFFEYSKIVFNSIYKMNNKIEELIKQRNEFINF